MIMFDRAKRIEFVTGFKKRKDERRVYAHEKIKEDLKSDAREIKHVKAIQK